MSQNIFQVYTNNPITSNASTDLMYFGQSPYGATNDAAMTYANFSAQFGSPYTPAALTSTNDTNVTITLGGMPSTAVLEATSLTLGWTGELSGARGGTGVNNGSSTITIGGNFSIPSAFTFTGTLTNNTAVTFPTSGTLATTSQFVNWVSAASTTITATVNTGYYITDASQVTITLPAVAAAGSIVSIVGEGAGGWILAPGSGQTIKVINQSASTSITSAGQYDCIEVLCTVANTTWVARFAMTTGFTIS